MPQLGSYIPLSASLSDGNTSKYVRAKGYDNAGNLIFTQGMPHVGSGWYASLNTQAMPNFTFVRAVYEVFDDSGFSTISNNYAQESSDIFELTPYGTTVIEVNGYMAGYVEPSNNLVGDAGSSNSLSGDSEPDNNLVGIILD